MKIGVCIKPVPNSDARITIASSGTHGVRVGQTIVLSDNQATPTIIKCYINSV